MAGDQSIPKGKIVERKGQVEEGIVDEGGGE